MTDTAWAEYGERIAALEAREEDRDQKLIALSKDVKEILGVLNRMTGGKRALLSLLVIIGTIVAVIGGLVAIFKPH